jgi:hypothetical protein
MLVNILGITDDAKCYAMVRHVRWPEDIRCPTATRPRSSSRAGTTPSHNAGGTSAGPAAAASMT